MAYRSDVRDCHHSTSIWNEPNLTLRPFSPQSTAHDRPPATPVVLVVVEYSGSCIQAEESNHMKFLCGFYGIPTAQRVSHLHHSIEVKLLGRSSVFILSNPYSKSLRSQIGSPTMTGLRERESACVAGGIFKFFFFPKGSYTQ